MKSLKFKFLVVLFVAVGIWILVAPFLPKFLIIEKPLEKADAIWVLGGSSAYKERTKFAAELYKKGIAPKIFVVNDGVFGGWNQAEQKNLPFYELSRRELIAQGVPNEAIEVLSENVTGTDWEAKLCAKIVREKQIKSLLLVTSAYHTKRAFWTFERIFSVEKQDIILGVVHDELIDEKFPTFFWWLSSKDLQKVFGEYLKFFYYWLFL
jgi:uncharacterized SAM-binding protein YcdF (DUF218 family)